MPCCHHPSFPCDPLYRLLIIEFFEKADHHLLVFYTDAKDQLTPARVFPAGIKKKVVFFRKADDLVVNAENVKTLDVGDVAYTQVDQLSSVVDGLLVPTLDGTNTTTKWPSVVSSDVAGHGRVRRSRIFMLC